MLQIILENERMAQNVFFALSAWKIVQKMRYKCLLIRQNKYIIKEPDAQTQSRQACEKSQLVGYFLENKML